jgi:hypothetical protein
LYDKFGGFSRFRRKKPVLGKSEMLVENIPTPPEESHPDPRLDISHQSGGEIVSSRRLAEMMLELQDAGWRAKFPPTPTLM